MAGEMVLNTYGEMTYNGVKRYRGEIFALAGAINDHKLIKVNHVRPVPADFNIDKQASRDDGTGRIFESEEARVNFRRTAPREVLIVRRPGRPRKVV